MTLYEVRPKRGGETSRCQTDTMDKGALVAGSEAAKTERARVKRNDDALQCRSENPERIFVNHATSDLLEHVSHNLCQAMLGLSA